MRAKINHIYLGDCKTVLKELDSNSVNCVVTSPPYWDLRDYGVDGQLGLEKTPEEYVKKLVEIFREIKRVLRKDGTVWLNLGDSYTNNSLPGGGDPTIKKRNIGETKYTATKVPELKPKNLIGIPWRVAFALQADGWWLRQDIIWHKPNPMPESVTDRCTKAHEYIFLLSKSAKYYYDIEAILQDCSPNTHNRISQDLINQIGSERAHGGKKTMKAVIRTPKQVKPGMGIKNNDSFNDAVCLPVEKRNKRSVWEVPIKGYKEAHFATFPPKLIEDCIKAGCPIGGIVLDPFIGSGTTAIVARKQDKNYIGIELNKEYVKMAQNRISKELGLFE